MLKAKADGILVQGALCGTTLPLLQSPGRAAGQKAPGRGWDASGIGYQASVSKTTDFGALLSPFLLFLAYSSRTPPSLVIQRQGVAWVCGSMVQHGLSIRAALGSDPGREPLKEDVLAPGSQLGCPATLHSSPLTILPPCYCAKKPLPQPRWHEIQSPKCPPGPM